MAQDLSSDSVADLLTGLLDDGYDATAGRVVDAIATDMNSGVIATRLQQLEAEAARLVDSGESLDASNPVFRALLADLETVLNDGRQGMNNAATGTIESGVTAGGQIQQQWSGLTVGWNEPDPAAIAAMVGFVDTPEFADMLDGYEEDVIETIINQMIIGSINGYSPTRIAQLIRERVESFPISLANTLMRTLQLQSYRTSATIYQNANQDVIRRVYRVASLDRRCCLACIALHGTVVWDSVINAGQPIPRIHDHHNGRCTSLVDTGVRDLRIQSGALWFNSLPRERQLELAGAGNLNALNSGAVTLNDFVHTVNDPVFGEMIVENSLTGVLGSGASQYYVRNQR